MAVDMNPCVKCSTPTNFYPIDASPDYYCEGCFLKVVKVSLLTH